MQYRRLGKTELLVSEIGLGGEWLERHTAEECKAVIGRCEEYGINILDCWMSEPNVRSNIGAAIEGHRDRWYIQGHLGSTWQDGQYVRTREMNKVKEAFEDLLTRLKTDYIDLGMIHFVDDEDEWEQIIHGPFMEYVNELKSKGIIRHVGMSTHNPIMAKKAALSGLVEMILFSVNPAFDILPATANLIDFFADKLTYGDNGIVAERAEVYKICEQNDIGITVMKGYAGGRLFDEKLSPFGVALTPVQCIHYALTRPAVASIMVGYDTTEHVDDAVHYESATSDEKNYASVLANAPLHSYTGQCTYCGHCKPCPQNIDIALVNKYYDLATMQPEIPASIQAHYQALDATAADCIACGGCESRCPFHVSIVKRMEMAAELFK